MTGKEEIRLAIRGLYDIQALRIQIGNRLTNHFLRKMGVEPGEKKTKEAERIMEKLKADYKRIADGLVKDRKLDVLLKETGLISTETEYALMALYETLVLEEKNCEKVLKKKLESIPIYTEFLKQVCGVGPLMAGVLVSELDPYKAKYVSSFWKYAGLDVVETEDGQKVGRSRKKECLEKVQYVDKNGEVKERLSLTYNPFLKAKLLGVLATAFLRSEKRGKGITYAYFYRNYKRRLENHPKYKDASKGHRDRMAKRYMIKMFLKDLYVEWRQLEGLPVHPPYSEAKLGIVHGNCLQGRA